MWKRQRSFLEHTIVLLWLAASFSDALLSERKIRQLHPLSGRSRRYTEDDGELYEREREIEVPTETMAALPEPDVVPSKPKIVVLGATGKIGRLVVRQLLETAGEATIVALVRDYDKACRVLYDDLMYVNKKKKNTCQILEKKTRSNRKRSSTVTFISIAASCRLL